MMFNKIYNNLKPFLIYDIALIVYLIIVYGIDWFLDIFFVDVNSFVLEMSGIICFYLIFIALFVKEGYVKKIKAGVFLFEIKLLVYPVLYMLSMVDSDEIPLPVSILSLGNIMYGDVKPITKLISDVNYNAVICIPDFLLSLILPVLSLSIGYFIKKKSSENSED